MRWNEDTSRSKTALSQLTAVVVAILASILMGIPTISPVQAAGTTPSASPTPTPTPTPPPTPAPLPAPPVTPTFTAAIDGAPQYQEQSICSPTPKAGTKKLAALLQATYGAYSTDISRACNDGGISEHKEGRAIDWMVSYKVTAQRARAVSFLKWLQATDSFGNPNAMARRLGIMYIGWNNRFWSGYSPEKGWTNLKGCLTDPAKAAASYDTYCHRNHVHISLTWEGASGLTSFWTGRPVAAECTPVWTSSQPALRSSGDLVAITPVHVLDTATGLGVGSPCRLSQKQWSSDQRDVVVRVAGRGGVPASGVAAVAVRVTATSASALTPTITVHGNMTSTAVPVVTPLSTGTYFGSAIAPVASDGTIRFSVNRGSTNLRVDVIGYARATAVSTAVTSTPAGTFHVLPAAVVFDGSAAPLQPGESRSVQLAGQSGIPTSGISAIHVTLTIDPSATPGSVQLVSHSGTVVAQVLAMPGVPRSVNALIPTADGSITLRDVGTSVLTAHITAQAWISTAQSGDRLSMFAVPATLIDTSKNVGLTGSWTAASTRTVALAGHGGVPTGATSVLLSVSALGGATADSLTVGSTASVVGVSFRAHMWAHDVVAVPLRADGGIDLTTASIGTGVTVRVLGFTS